MKKPENIVTLPRLGKTYEWVALNPDKADYRAIWGLRGPNGSTFLILESGDAVAVGLWAGIYRAHEAEFLSMVTKECYSLDTCHPGMTGMDRRIKKAIFESWKK